MTFAGAAIATCTRVATRVQRACIRIDVRLIHPSIEVTHSGCIALHCIASRYTVYEGERRGGEN